MKRVLPTTLIARLKEDPEDMLNQFDADVDTPELIWDASMRNELRQVLGNHIDLVLQRRPEHVISDETTAQNLFVKYSRLDDEVYIGGVYLARFVKDPTYSLRDPTSFLEQLLRRWAKEVEVYTTDQLTLVTTLDTAIVSSNGPDTLELVTDAIIYICKVRDSLCDKVAEWGYMARSVAFLDALLLRNKVGNPLLAIVRLLHVCSSKLSNIEALALIGTADGHQGVVELIVKAIGKDSLHPDSAFMVEFLKKAYVTALGDVDKAHSQEYLRTSIGPSFIAMAPSPAPGDGPVRKKVSAGEDPLGMMQFEQPDHSHIATPQVDRAGIAPEVSQDISMNLIHTNPNASVSFIGTANIHQENSSQRSTDHPRYSQTNHFTAGPTIREPPNLTIAHGNNLFHNPVSSQTTYPHVTSTSSIPQHSIASQVLMDPRQHVFQARSPLGLPVVNQNVHHRQYHNQYQQHQNVGSPQIHHQFQSNDRPQNVSAYQQQHQYQQRTVQEQLPSTQQYHQPMETKPIDNNYYQVQQHLPQSYQYPSLLHEQQYKQNPMITGSQSTQAYPPLPHYQNAAQYHQSHQMSQDRTPIRTRQEPTQNNALDKTTTIGNGNQPLSQGALQHQMQHSTLPAVYISSDHAHVGQQPQHHYVTTSTAAVHDGIGTYGTMTGSQEDTEVRSSNETGTQHLDVHLMTSQPPPYKPTPMIENRGIIDARSGVDPIQIAEQQKIHVSGAPNSSRGRISWLQQAVATNICSFLINNVLEGSSLSQIRDPVGAKVHAIALIKLLLKDPGYGSQFQLILKEIPAWKKYKSQDHSLLITGHEQRTDYFLADGGRGINKLLTDH